MSLFTELRRILRGLRKNFASSLLAVVAMAFGIGLTTTMVSVVDGVLLSDLPFENAERLIHLERNDLERGVASMGVPAHDFADWRGQQQSFEGLAAFTGGNLNVSDDELPERLRGAWISTNFLELLRTAPLLGRSFGPEDEQPGAAPVLLIGYDLWQSRYGGDPRIVGQTLRANSIPTTIIGVLPEGFHFPLSEQVWLPLELPTATLGRGEGTKYEVFGRLREGVSLDQAASEMTVIASRLADLYPTSNQGVGAVLKPYKEEFAGEMRAFLGVIAGAVGLVLLVACFNVANLLLVRAFGRRNESAIRRALGASRLRTILEVLSEAVMISLLGAMLGISLAQVGIEALQRTLSTVPGFPFWMGFALDFRVLLLSIGISALAATVAGLLPGLQASRDKLQPLLKDGPGSGEGLRVTRLSRTLVVTEVAISGALMVGAVLLVRSVLAAQTFDFNFDPKHVITARVALFETDYPEARDWVAFYDSFRRSLEERPEIVSAAVGSFLPADGKVRGSSAHFERPGETYTEPRDMPWTRLVRVTPGYFETLGVGILTGRDLTEGDTREAPAVAVVNETFARKEWPGQSPIGQRVDLWMGSEEEAAGPGAGVVEVVGVVPELRFAEFDNGDDLEAVYVPMAQKPQHFAWILARTRGEPEAFGRELKAAVTAVDPHMPLYYLRSMEQVVDETRLLPRIIGAVFSSFGVLALVISALGLYGVMAFSVSQRTREMGVRMALGAHAGNLLTMVLRQGLRRITAGLILGLALGTLLAQGLRKLLFQVQPTDPATLLGIAVFIVAVSLLACYVPARRAASTDPMTALRGD